MRKGYIMIFLTAWVIGIIFLIGLFIVKSNYTFNSNVGKTLTKDKNEIEIENKNAENKLEVISTFASDEEQKDKCYVIKEKDGYISIYIIDEEGNEILRKNTNIVTRYLSEIDKSKLREGIKVNNKEELNKTLEDFE